MTQVKEKNVSSVTTSIDKVGFCLVITTVIIIFIVVILGVCARFFLEENVSRIVLIALICFLCVLGMVVLFALELRRRKYAKQVPVTTQVTVRNGQYYNLQPSAPQDRDTSWEYTNRATVPV